jgi:ABC-type nitrate/sulfonate/bicarbonate transport system substrate-binding protein
MTPAARSPRVALLVFVAALGLSGTPPASAESITVGKAVAPAWTFTPIDIGVQVGILKKHGFDEVKIVAFGGDAKLQQALLSKDIDFGLASGPGMAFNARGGGGYGVAAYYGAPRNLGISVKYDSKTMPKDLKGGKVAVSTPGSLTDWLTRRLSTKMGWGHEGITPVPLGAPTASVSAVETGQVDGGVISTEMTYALEAKKRIKQVYNFSELVPNFITHVIFARKDHVKDDKAMVKRFVAAWFDTIDYMASHKDKAVEISAKVLNSPPPLIARIYDWEMPEFSRTGRFDPEAVALLKQSFIDMKALDRKPADAELFTEEFLPKKSTITN